MAATDIVYIDLALTPDVFFNQDFRQMSVAMAKHAIHAWCESNLMEPLTRFHVRYRTNSVIESVIIRVSCRVVSVSHTGWVIGGSFAC